MIVSSLSNLLELDIDYAGDAQFRAADARRGESLGHVGSGRGTEGPSKCGSSPRCGATRDRQVCTEAAVVMKDLVRKLESQLPTLEAMLMLRDVGLGDKNAKKWKTEKT